MKPEHRKYILDHLDSKSAKQMAAKLNIKERTVARLIDAQKSKQTEQVQKVEVVKKSGKKLSLWLVLVVALVGFAVYSNTLPGKFIWDDNILVKNNIEIRDWGNLKKVVFGNLGGENLYYKHSSFRPVQTITYMVDYHFGKMDPFGYRLSNIIFHVLVALSLYWLIFVLFSSNFVSFVTSLLYVIHPIHTEAVAYISGRADPLSSIFMLLCMVFYFKYTDKRSLWLIPIMLLSYMLGILSRENALMAPFFLLVYHFTYKKKIAWKAFATLAVFAILYIIARKLELVGAMALKEPVKTSVFERLPGFFIALASYFKLLVWPFDLHMEYGRPTFPMSHPMAIVGLFIFIGLSVLAVISRQKRPIVTFGILWFFVGLFPVSNTVVVVNAYMAEHWLYFCSIGLFLMLATGLNFLYQKKQFRIGVVVFIAAMTVFHSYLTYQQNKTWLDPIVFYERTREYAPKSGRLHADLGEAYYSAGRKVDALNSTLRAIEIRPNYYAAYSNLGTIYMSLGQRENAIKAYQNSLRILPSYFNAWFNLGNVYKDQGDCKRAIIAYENAIKYKPSLANAYNNLAICYSREGNKERAIYYYEAGIKINPKNTRFYNNLASTYSDVGRHKEAVSLYNKALQFGPPAKDVPIIYYNLSLGYARLGDQANARIAFDRANSYQLDAASYQRLAQIYSKTGLNEQAEFLMKKASQVGK